MMLLEAGLTVSTMWLAYVTQLPYPARKRLHARLRQHCYRFYVLCRHHGHWVLWQITVILPRKRG